jgi:hypothetical protein
LLDGSFGTGQLPTSDPISNMLQGALFQKSKGVLWHAQVEAHNFDDTTAGTRPKISIQPAVLLL